jgi:hypothetical protein
LTTTGPSCDVLAMQPDVRAQIQRLVDAFVSDLEELVRQAALETVATALGTSAASRGGSRPRGGSRSGESGVGSSGQPRWRARKAASAGRPVPAAGRARRNADQIEATGERIVQHVKGNPGARSEDIRAALGLAKSEWQLTVKRLVESGRLATRGEKRATTYFAKGEGDHASERPRLGIVRRPGRGAAATPPAEEPRSGEEG